MHRARRVGSAIEYVLPIVFCVCVFFCSKFLIFSKSLSCSNSRCSYSSLRYSRETKGVRVLLHATLKRDRGVSHGFPLSSGGLFEHGDCKSIDLSHFVSFTCLNCWIQHVDGILRRDHFKSIASELEMTQTFVNNTYNTLSPVKNPELHSMWFIQKILFITNCSAEKRTNSWRLCSVTLYLNSFMPKIIFTSVDNNFSSASILYG